MSEIAFPCALLGKEIETLTDNLKYNTPEFEEETITLKRIHQLNHAIKILKNSER